MKRETNGRVQVNRSAERVNPDEPSTFIVFSTVSLELRLRERSRKSYLKDLLQQIGPVQDTLGRALALAKQGNFNEAMREVRAIDSSLVRVFTNKEEAAGYVEQELAKVEGTTFNDRYCEEQFGRVTYMSIYLESS